MDKAWSSTCMAESFQDYSWIQDFEPFSKCWMRQIYDSFSDLCLIDLMSIDHLNLKFLIIFDIHDSVIFYIRFEF